MAGSIYLKNFDQPESLLYFPENGSRIFFIPALASGLYVFRRKHSSLSFLKFVLFAIGIDILVHIPEIWEVSLSYMLRLILSMAIGGALSILAVGLYSRFKKPEVAVPE